MCNACALLKTGSDAITLGEIPIFGTGTAAECDLKRFEIRG